MSTTETTEQTAVACPGCAGPLEPMQTICTACRAALEEQVLAVRAADYPALFHNVVRNSTEPHRDPVDPTSMDMLKAAENTSDDLDLVPLVPMDEPRKPAGGAVEAGTPATAATSTPTAISGSAVSAGEVAMASSPSPVISQAPVTRLPHTAYTPPSAPKLEPSSRWKHVVIAVGSVIAAAALAALFWSILVPHRQADTPDDTAAAKAVPAAAKPASK